LSKKINPTNIIVNKEEQAVEATKPYQTKLKSNRRANRERSNEKIQICLQWELFTNKFWALSWLTKLSKRNIITWGFTNKLWGLSRLAKQINKWWTLPWITKQTNRVSEILTKETLMAYCNGITL